MTLLACERLVKVYERERLAGLGARADSRGRRVRRAVDEVGFEVEAGETFALVGESGCGKTTVARMVTGLLRPSSGRVLLDGVDVWRLDRAGLAAFRRRVQIVFQDPAAALDPRQRVGAAIEEPLVVHRLGSPTQRRREVARLLALVGLDPAEGGRFPHQLSGGQKQRVLVARALALRPELLVLDEPVSALDVSVRAQVLNVLAAIQKERGLGYLFISHDLGVVRHVADRVAVMHLGRLVEAGPAEDVWSFPAHPYTRALLEAVPVADPASRPPPPECPPPEPAPAPADWWRGCSYRSLCSRAQAVCHRRRPPAVALPEPPASVTRGGPGGGHWAACHFALTAIVRGDLKTG